ncbi:MAG TPA: AAA family ATPase [Hanamia sp.]|nr:AAA family ATPase [Hanamia sp.]
MKIIIKKLNIVNFKGIKNLEINFNHITDIFGENAAGKTTIFDAFTWLFFGKDSTDRKDFELKPIDKNGKVSEKVDVEVSAIIEVDGKPIEVKKVLHEKWVKKRGDQTPKFEGNENLFYWNDVPAQLKQYQEKIGELLNENIFKLITNPLYFNSLKWQDRRSVLLQIAGEITNEELINGNPDFAPLAKILKDKSLEEYKREVAAKKKKIKADLEAIPTRIDEIIRNMPAAVDFDSLRKSVEEKEKEIAVIDSALQDATKVMQSAFEAKRKQQNELHELKTKAANLKSEIRSKVLNAHNKRKETISGLEFEIRLKESGLKTLESAIESHANSIIGFNNELQQLRDQWLQENKRQLIFDEKEFVCPACERELEEDHIHETKEKLTNNFNVDKAKNLTAIVSKSDLIKTKLDGYQSKIKELVTELSDRKINLETLHASLDSSVADHNKITANSESEFNNELEGNQEYAGILSRITEMESVVSEDVKPADNSALQEKKSSLKIEVDVIKRQLTDEDVINKSITRRTELEEEEVNLSQQLADLEGNEYLAEQFTKAKMDTLVQRINGRFKYVTFKLFDHTIDGGEFEMCDTLVNGVPFTDANNAGKINAGIDIINTLCEHYNTYAPIFIDNRESVNNLIDCNSQVVNLIVSTDKKLRVA